jgi:E3 ubiquitin-protein ligase TRIP12
MNQDNTNQSSKNASKQTSKQSSTSATSTTTATTAAGTTAPTSGTVSSAASSVGPLSGFASASFAGADRGIVGLIESADSSDNDATTAEFSRLTDLLQARGLPTHIVNAFGSKVQQFLHRTMSSGITSRSSQLVNSLQQNDESLKLTALSELCQLLVMGNEDTLVGFPIKQAVPLLLQCMRSDSENYVLMNHACRALTYMMESLPRSSSIIAEGIGVFLEKLQVIQCMDVAEQSLTALEILSRRHSKQILNATQSGSISACLTYIDFFSITAQRNALQITANCCQNVIKDEFVHIQSSLPILSQRLSHSDKKSVESVCTVFARLVENFQRDRLILKEIASHQVLTNMQQLLVTQPAVVSPSIFVTVLHTIYLMCANCNELAIELLENNIAGTFKQLLVGAKTTSEQDQTLLKQHETIEILSSRSPQELYEIVSIIGEIMPRLPQTGLFAIDEILRKTYLANQNEHVLWQWKDERDVWRPYTPVDSRIIESAFSQEEDECILNTMGRTYVLDFNSMLQINEDTGTTRPIARKVLSSTSQQQQSSSTLSSNNNVNTISSNNETISASGTNNFKQNDFTTIQVKEEDNRLSYLEKNPKLYAQFVSTLFSILYEVYNSSAGPAIKHRSLRAILRMIYYSSKNVINQDDNNNNKGTSPAKLNEDSKTTATVQQEALAKSTNNSENNILYNLLKTLPISSHIASMLASTDPKIIVSALQICEILMQKMPDVFSVYFHREGVIHQIDRLIETGSVSSSAQKAAMGLSNQINSVKVEQKTSDNTTVTASIPSSSSVAPAKPSEQSIYQYFLISNLFT